MQTPLLKLHKRHFQLLELMVAAFILLICISPTMRIFTNMLKGQKEIVRQNERDHLAHLVHAKLTEEFYQQRFPLGEENESKPIAIGDPDLEKLLRQHAYRSSATYALVYSRKEKKELLYKIVIKMRDLTLNSEEENGVDSFENANPSDTFYDYYLFIDRKQAGIPKQDSPPGQSDQPKSQINAHPSSKLTPATPPKSG